MEDITDFPIDDLNVPLIADDIGTIKTTMVFNGTFAPNTDIDIVEPLNDNIVIDRNLILAMHQSYMDEYETYQAALAEYKELVDADPKNLRLQMNPRLIQGQCSILIGVINDLRYILDLEPLDESPFGIHFNQE